MGTTNIVETPPNALPVGISSNFCSSLVAWQLPQGEGLEEALEQLAILVGSQEVDDIADKFKVDLPSTS